MPASQARRAALVTGASHGIGAAIAIALAKDGCDVAITDLRPADLAATAPAIEAGGGRAVPLSLDVCDQDSVEAGFVRAVEAFGGFDVLVNNAGVPRPGRRSTSPAPSGRRRSPSISPGPSSCASRWAAT